MDQFTFGVVDQSPIRKGGSAQQALQETVQLAQLAEGFGYHRYWVAEHHNSGNFAGTSPEILIGQIASQTQSIVVGSGGVMLSHYSALKVAENFSVLKALYPDRIELGIGRAPGSDQVTAQALAYPRPVANIQEFPQQVVDVIGFLAGTIPEEHPFSSIKAQSGSSPNAIPGVWLLGSSDYSARLAAALGLPFSFADFFGTTAEHGPMIADLYRKQFRPSEYLEEPRFNVALQVICADTEEKAELVLSSNNVSRVNRLKGIREPLVSPEEAIATEFTPVELQHLEQSTKHLIVGTPEMIKEGVAKAAQAYSTTDVSIATNCYYFADRVRSFELVAEAFALNE